MSSLSWKQTALLLVSVLFVLGIQLSQINRPFRGHFASYQATVMASIARNMVQEDFKEMFLPKTNLLIVTPQKSLHLNQYPFPSLLVAVCVKFLGGSYEFWGRFQAVCFNLLSAFLLLMIGNRLFDRNTGVIACALFLLLPYPIIYGQMFLGEPMAVFCLLASMGMIIRKTGASFWGNIASALLFSLAVTGRVHFVLFLPFLLILSWTRSGGRIAQTALFLVLSLLLPAAWYLHTFIMGQQHTLLTHTSLFFQAGTPTVFGMGLLKRPDYWRQVFDIFSGVMFTPLVFPFVIGGLALLCAERKKERALCLWGTAGGLLLLFLTPKKVVDQEFYLYGLFPFLVLVAAYALGRLSESFALLKKPAILLIGLLLLMATSARYFIHPMFKYPADEAKVPAVGEWVQQETQPGDIVIVAGSASALLVYYIDRPAFGLSLEKDKVFPPYFMMRRFSPSEQQIIKNLKDSMRDEASLLELLRSKGAAYILISNEKEGIPHTFLEYLETHYAKLPSKFSGVCLLKLFGQ